MTILANAAKKIGKSIKATKATTKKVTSMPKAKATIARKEVAIPRDGFFLTKEDIAKYQGEYRETKVMPIPHNQGSYKSIIQALLNLGKNKPHSFKALKSEVMEIMSAKDTIIDGKTLWQRWTKKEAHSDENAKNIDQKLHQNVEVLQRLGGQTPYGLRLKQIGTSILKTKGVVIDVLSKRGERFYMLNTNSAAPVNEFKRARKA